MQLQGLSLELHPRFARKAKAARRPYSRSLIARCISRFVSRSLIAWRLS
jgi:hypothetical protein